MNSGLRGWRRWLAVGLLTTAAALDVRAATLLVWSESAAPAPPYDSWPTAAQTIQDAVDAASFGDTVLVTNGVYAIGGRMVWDLALFNRLVIQKEIIVRSVNGPEGTIVKGAAAPGGGTGGGAIRCVYLGAGAVLEGFTLTEGHTLNETGTGGMTNRAGGGVFCENRSAVVTNCVISGNGADYGGGGAYGGSLYSCRIVGNKAIYGGGAYDSELVNCRLLENTATWDGGGADGSLYYLAGGATLFRGSSLRNCVLAGNRAGSRGGGAANGVVLYNCTVTGNSAGLLGGGVGDDVLGYNCIVFYNQAPTAPNHYYSYVSSKGSLRYSCTVPLVANPFFWLGNIDLEPQLASATHLRPTSPCIGAGSIDFANGVDIDGEPWSSPPCIGADQVVPGPALGPLSVAISPDHLKMVTGQLLPQLKGQIEGQTSGSQWDFGDGTTLTNLTYQPFVSHPWNLPGTYLVKLSAFNAAYPAGVLATSTVDVVEGRYTLYVNAANPSPAAPYTSWATAAQTIDDAIQAALPGGTILVTNGVYNLGGRNVNGMTRVAIDKPLTVHSVSGPPVTVILGAENMRCAYVSNGAELSGFTLMQGVGGAACEPEGVISNCVILENGTLGSGGGVYGGRIFNSRIERNTASEGGGVHSATVVNSVLADNWASGKGGGAVSCILSNCSVVGNLAGVSGGGVLNSSAYNSVIYYNSSPTNSNYAGLNECRYSCTIPLPAGEGNIADEPALASVLRLSSASPCIGAGSSLYASGVDMDGEPWTTPPCIGADQLVPANLEGPLLVAVVADRTRIADGFETTFRARIEGRVSRHVWDFGDGSTVTNMPTVAHAWASPGSYEVRLAAFNNTLSEGVAASITIEVVAAPSFYVNQAGGNPVPPYVTWDTAATNIQQAIDASVPGRRIWVTNGVYETGSRLTDDDLANRVVVDRAVRLESVNGPAATSIRGGYGVRGVYLWSNAILSGFTVSQGSGGGVWCQTGAVVTNCWLDGNDGGGVRGGTLYQCRLSGNQSAFGAGAYRSVLYDCVLTNNAAGSLGSAGGGGAFESTLFRCTLVSNKAHGFRGSGSSGGALGGILYNCLLRDNSADFAGGAGAAELYCCTVVNNTAEGEWWINHRGGGLLSCKVWNSIIYHNNAAADANYDTNTVVNFSCTTPLPTSGVGNIDSDPGFADLLAGDFRLALGSPCIDTGTNLLTLVTTDLVGTPRPLDGNGDGIAAFDMGAYEFLLPTADSNGDGIPDGWTWQYGLNPTEPNVASSDPDLDGITTGQEWIANTDPTNPVSFFRIEITTAAPPIAATFLSSSNRLYTLESCADLNHAAWAKVAGQTDIPGNGNLLSLVDTDSSTDAYYRVSVRLP